MKVSKSRGRRENRCKGFSGQRVGVGEATTRRSEVNESRQGRRQREGVLISESSS